MRRAEIIGYQKARLRSPWVLGPVLLLGTVVFAATMMILVQTPGGLRPGTWFVVFLGTYSLALWLIWASPIPWLWTGGRASHAPLWRGLLQSALFNMGVLACLSSLQVGFALLLGVKDLFKPVGAMTALGSAFIQWVPLAMLLGYFFTLWDRTRWVKDETEKKLREAHWVLLRGQLSPHVLFNSLNALAELVRIDPVAAEQAILDLSGLYRALLDHGSRASAPLGDERRLVERYLAVEQVRLGNRLNTLWEWDEALNPVEMPPFLVQPLVENALKHGISPCIEGGSLRVGARRDGSAIILSVANTGKPLPLVLGNGVGVRNLEARLYLTYGNKAGLRLFADGQWTVAEIRVDHSLKEIEP